VVGVVGGWSVERIVMAVSWLQFRRPFSGPRVCPTMLCPRPRLHPTPSPTHPPTHPPAVPLQADIAELQREAAERRRELEGLEAEAQELRDRVAANRDAGALPPPPPPPAVCSWSRPVSASWVGVCCMFCSPAHGQLAGWL
jgi:hypothetical protein